MSTLRELAAESIGRITRRGLEPQLAQIDAALGPGERTLAVAPGHDGPAGVVVTVTDRRLLRSSGAPFTPPVLDAHPLADVATARALGEGATWVLEVELAGGEFTVSGMFDRDAQRLAALLNSDRAR